MNFKPDFASIGMRKISIDKFIRKYKTNNPKEDVKELKGDLVYFKRLRVDGATCNCGNPIWVIGSAIAGKNFVCTYIDEDLK